MFLYLFSWEPEKRLPTLILPVDGDLPHPPAEFIPILCRDIYRYVIAPEDDEIFGAFT